MSRRVLGDQCIHIAGASAARERERQRSQKCSASNRCGNSPIHGGPHSRIAPEYQAHTSFAAAPQLRHATAQPPPWKTGNRPQSNHAWPHSPPSGGRTIGMMATMRRSDLSRCEGVSMAEASVKENVKRVFYVRFLNHPIYLDLIAQRPEIRLDKLENDSPAAAAGPIVAAAHAYQVSSARDELPQQYHVTKEFLARAPNLLIVSTGGAGYDTVNVKDCTEGGVLVVNQTGGNADAVASHVLGVMLLLSKKIVHTDHALRAGTMHDRNAFMGNDIHGRTIGIVGLGNVGRRIAKLCNTLFGMQVLACDPFLDEKSIAERGAAKVTLDELLRRSDFVSINCPLDDTSRNMISTREFGLMQKHAYFITSARGHIHDEKALEEALRSKQIAGAGLDVWAKEPPDASHPLLQFDNVIASPHTAGVTSEARANMGKFAAEQLILTLDGKRPPRIVNPEVWPAYTKRFERTFGIRPQG
jgi:D-3-phosphoglycerate dehydrogenase / 2-oxoglutarate reductase